MHEKRFSGDINRLRSAERVERLEVERVIQLCLEGGSFKGVLDVGTGSGLFDGLVLHERDDPRGALQAARHVSRKRVCLLEWPYREQPFGPPMEDRLSPA